jgi:hypothetical protein
MIQSKEREEAEARRQERRRKWEEEIARKNQLELERRILEVELAK